MRCWGHGVEVVSQNRRVPTDWPGLGARRCSPRRRRVKPRRSTSEHGRRRVRLTAGSLERPHRDAPRPRFVEGGLGCTPWRRRRRVAPTARTRTTSPSTATASATAPPSPARLGGGGRTKKRRRRRSGRAQRRSSSKGSRGR